MNIALKYKNGHPDYSLVTDRIPLFEEAPILIDIARPNGRKRQESLADIMVNFEYLFRDLKNMHDTDIEDIEITDCILGEYTKRGNDVDYTPGEINIYNMIIYSFYSDVFAEKLLFTCNNDAVKRAKSHLSFDGNYVNEDLIGTGAGKSASFLEILRGTIKRQLPQYNMKFDFIEHKIIYTYKGAALKDIDSIPDDDIFIFFKFVELLVSKKSHFGLFFIDCSLFRPHVLRALLSVIDLDFLSGRLVFLYNCDSQDKKSAIKNLQTFVLPNHKIPMEDLKKNEKK